MATNRFRQRINPRSAEFAAAVVAAGRKVSRGNVGSGSVICDFQSNGSIGTPSGSTGATAALDTSVTYNGQPTMKYTMGATGTFQCSWTFTTPVTVAQLRTMQIPICFSKNSNDAVTAVFDTATLWFVLSSGGSVRHSLYASGRRGDAFATLSPAAGNATQGWTFGAPATATTDLDADAATVASINLVIAVNAEEVGESVWIGPITANRRNEGIVVLTLDGQYSSQDRWILPMIEAQGLLATINLQHSVVGDAGRMTYAQISRAKEVGHEIGHHTFDSSKSAGYQSSVDWADENAIYADIAAGVSNLQARGYVSGNDPIVAIHGGSTHPYAATVSNTRQRAVVSAYRRAGVSAIRTGAYVNGSYARTQPTGAGDIDPYGVIGCLQITSPTTPAEVQDYVDFARERGEMAIITIHRSVVATPGSLEMTNADFLTWITYLGQQVRSGGVLNMPFGSALQHVGAI